MRVPLDWLRDYVEFDVPTDELAKRLTISTAMVQHIFRRGIPDANGNADHYLVGRVVEAGKHPNADRLQLCRVDVGEGEPRQIVCGAWNFGEGATVAVALPGAVLPGGMKLEEAKLRGEVSRGMILSEQELELGQDHSGILVLEDGPEPGTPLREVLPLGEDVIELELTPNRPDLLSVYGVAREVAALYGSKLEPPPGTDPARDGDEEVDVRVDDLERCPRYIGRTFTGAAVGASPAWMKARLIGAGMRPISNVVDVTNYVMLALGSPLHAFDRAKLREGRIVVRRARKGEQMTALDSTVRTLDEADLVIADAERPVAIAGIMGSLESEVDEQTSELLLEAANFEPIGILRTSERLGLRSEASSRWEKGIDPYLAEPAARLATQLFVELAGARWTGETDVHDELPAPAVITLRPERTDEVLGLETPPAEQHAILERLGFEVAAPEVTVPTWRARDVTREIDLVEEVARIRLDEVPYTLPARREMFGRLSTEQRLRRVVEDVLLGAGLYEAYTPSLLAEDPDAKALRIPGAAVERAGSASHPTAPEPRRGRPVQPRRRQHRDQALRDRTRLPADRWQAPGRALDARRGRRGRLRAREGRRRDALRHARARAALRARRGSAAPSGQDGARRRGGRRRATSRPARGRVGSDRARSLDAPRGRCPSGRPSTRT